MSVESEELRERLRESLGEERQVLAKEIVSSGNSFESYLFLIDDAHVRFRFMWLVTDLALLDVNFVRPHLVSLFDRCKELDGIDLAASFANYWKLCGIPQEREGEWVDLAFSWFNSPQTNVTAKSIALSVLLEQLSKFPELKEELILLIQEQKSLYSESFERSCEKSLFRLL